MTDQSSNHGRAKKKPARRLLVPIRRVQPRSQGPRVFTGALALQAWSLPEPLDVANKGQAPRRVLHRDAESQKGLQGKTYGYL